MKNEMRNEENGSLPEPVRRPPEGRQGVIFSVLRLSRALRRCPPEHRDSPFPPALGRLLACVQEHDGVSSRELCELLDLRPSSLSEMLSRAEAMGLLRRETDANDRRVVRVCLREEGRALVRERAEARRSDDERKTACFSDEEAMLFCRLAGRLADHLEALAPRHPSPEEEPPCGRGPRHPGRPGCGRELGPGRFGRPPFGEEAGPRGGRPHPAHRPPFEEEHPPFGEERRKEEEPPAEEGESRPAHLPEGARIRC